MKKHRLIRLTIVLLALFTLAMVLPTVIAAMKSTRQTGTGSLTYRLAWQAGDPAALDGDTGWTVQNDLGYQVTVEQAYVVTYWLQLIECEPHDEHALDEDTAALPDLLMPGIAHANHGSDSNQTRSNMSAVESLTGSPTGQVLTELSVNQEAYCQAHYLIGPASVAASDLPDDVDMRDRSLYVSGSYRAPGTEVETPFVIDSSMAFGVILPLHVTGGQVMTGGEAVEIVVVRDRTAIFDGLDFEGAPSEKMARAVLRRLTHSAQVVVSD